MSMCCTWPLVFTWNSLAAVKLVPTVPVPDIVQPEQQLYTLPSDPKLLYKVVPAIAGVARAITTRQSNHPSFLFKVLPPWLRVFTREDLPSTRTPYGVLQGPELRKEHVATPKLLVQPLSTFWPGSNPPYTSRKKPSAGYLQFCCRPKSLKPIRAYFIRCKGLQQSA